MSDPINIVSCGCCSNGCVCHIHQDAPNGLPPRVCDRHNYRERRCEVCGCDMGMMSLAAYNEAGRDCGEHDSDAQDDARARASVQGAR